MIRRSRTSVQSRRHQAASAAAQFLTGARRLLGRGCSVARRLRPGRAWVPGPALPAGASSPPSARRLRLPDRPGRPSPKGQLAPLRCPTATQWQMRSHVVTGPGPRRPGAQVHWAGAGAAGQKQQRRGRTHVSLSPAGRVPPAGRRQGQGESSLRPGSTRRRQPCKWKITKGRARPPNLLDPSSSTVHSAPLKG